MSDNVYVVIGKDSNISKLVVPGRDIELATTLDWDQESIDSFLDAYDDSQITNVLSIIIAEPSDSLDDLKTKQRVSITTMGNEVIGIGNTKELALLAYVEASGTIVEDRWE